MVEIVAIDPGIGRDGKDGCGIARLRFKGPRIADCTTWRVARQRGDSGHQRTLAEIREALVEAVTDETDAIGVENQINVMAAKQREGVRFQAANYRVALVQGLAYAPGLPVFEIEPNRLKRIVTGSATADKATMIRAVSALTGSVVATSHEADAIAIGLAARQELLKRANASEAPTAPKRGECEARRGGSRNQTPRDRSSTLEAVSRKFNKRRKAALCRK